MLVGIGASAAMLVLSHGGIVRAAG
jgi:hypothetical protein